MISNQLIDRLNHQAALNLADRVRARRGTPCRRSPMLAGMSMPK